MSKFSFGNWAGETCTREGLPAVKLTRDTDGASVEIAKKYDELGNETAEVITDIKDAKTYEDAMDAVAAAAGLAPGFSWIGDAAAGVGKKGIGYIEAYNRKMKIAMGDIDGTTDTDFTNPQKIPTQYDPLTLDLNGNGIETVSTSTPPLLFDLAATGIKTSTGWVAPSDGLLVLDRNGNGTIDSGAELFGNATNLYNGKGKATDGFAALAQEDTNGDGLVNDLDANWASLRVWQDLNQDGISQTNELTTLDQQGIVSLNVGRTVHSQNLPNGNGIKESKGSASSLIVNRKSGRLMANRDPNVLVEVQSDLGF